MGGANTCAKDKAAKIGRSILMAFGVQNGLEMCPQSRDLATRGEIRNLHATTRFLGSPYGMPAPSSTTNSLL
jgi:hypothetical protein